MDSGSESGERAHVGKCALGEARPGGGARAGEVAWRWGVAVRRGYSGGRAGAGG